MPVIRLVAEKNEMDAVFAFRYRVYVLELAKRQDFANHDRKIVAEPLDESGDVFAAFENGDVVGTLRLNWASNEIGYYQKLYRTHVVGPYLDGRATITTKLIVGAAHRGTSLGMRLAVAAFTHGYARGSRFDFIDCDPRGGLQPFFEKLGYRRLFPNFVHPEYGLATPLLLAAADRQHLEKVGSPFAKCVRAIGEDPSSVNYFYSQILPLASVREGQDRGAVPCRT